MGTNDRDARAGEVAGNSDWVTLLKDNTRTGGLGAAALANPGKAKWQMRVGSTIRTAPVFRGGTLYVTAMQGHLHAISAETGREKWKFKAGGELYSTPSLCRNFVLFGSNDGRAYAVNAESGTKAWEAKTDGEAANGWKDSLDSVCNGERDLSRLR